jgi:hypothetical protein
MRCYNPPNFKKESHPVIKVKEKGEWGVDWLPWQKNLRVVGPHEFFMFPRGFILGVIIPLNLVKLGSIVSGDSVLLLEDIGGICLVCQVLLQCDGMFNNNIGWELHTSFELGDMKHVVNSQ